MKWFFYLMKIITYLPLRLLYPVKIIGRKNMPKGKVIAVGNHLSAADIVMQLSNLPGFRYIVAKKELSKNKFVGAFLAALGAIYIDRGKADLSAMKKMDTACPFFRRVRATEKALCSDKSKKGRLYLR